MAVTLQPAKADAKREFSAEGAHTYDERGPVRMEHVRRSARTEYAKLERPLSSAELAGSRFIRVDLRAANLESARNVDRVRFDDCTWDERTKWPAGYSPSRGGVVVDGKEVQLEE